MVYPSIEASSCPALPPCSGSRLSSLVARRRAKRAGDILLAITALAILLPLLLLIALLVRLESPGPVLFRQRRVGLGNAVFDILKFRTMQVQPTGPLRQVSKGDRRVTRVGAFLRRTSLDELPVLRR